jgi:hypothetical protein
VDIQGLAPYLPIDGKEIYSRCGQRDAYPKAFPPDGERTDLISAENALWHGAHGWSEARWNFWKHRLGEIRDTEPVRQDNKDIIDRVINEMGRVEKEVR